MKSKDNRKKNIEARKMTQRKERVLASVTGGSQYPG